MESYAMDKLELNAWGLVLNAEGMTAIVAAILIVGLVLFSRRFK